MGGVVNPTTFRLGWSRIWLSSWALADFTNSKYTYLIRHDFILKQLIGYLLHRYDSLEILCNSPQIIRYNKQISIICPYNAAWLDRCWDEFLFFFWNTRQTFFEGEKLSIISFKKRHPAFSFQKWNLWKFFLRLWQRFLLKYFNISQVFLVYSMLELTMFQILRSFWFNPLVQSFAILKSNFAALYNIDFIFVPWFHLDICASNLVRFIVERLKRYAVLNQVIRSVRFLLGQLLSAELIAGYKLKYKGRFLRLGRRGRASCTWESKGMTALSSAEAPVSYGTLALRLRYSTCGFKVWLLHTQ